MYRLCLFILLDNAPVYKNEIFNRGIVEMNTRLPIPITRIVHNAPGN